MNSVSTSLSRVVKRHLHPHQTNPNCTLQRLEVHPFPPQHWGPFSAHAVACWTERKDVGEMDAVRKHAYTREG